MYQIHMYCFTTESCTKYICIALLQSELEKQEGTPVYHTCSTHHPLHVGVREGGREDGETTCMLCAIRLVDALSKSYLCMSTNINPKL